MSFEDYEILNVPPWTNLSLSVPKSATKKPPSSLCVDDEADSDCAASTSINPKSEVFEESHAKVYKLVDITQHESDRSDRPRVFLTPTEFQAKQEVDAYAQYSMVVRRRFRRLLDREAHSYVDTTLEINDEIIRKAVRHGLGDCPFLRLSGSVIEIKSPYRELFYYRAQLDEYIHSPDRTAEEPHRLAILTKFMDDHLHKTIRAYNIHVPYKEITFDLLWTIYRPDSVVVSHRDGITRAFRIRRCNCDFVTVLRLECYSWGYQAGRFGRVLENLEVRKFAGVLKIRDLQEIPLDFLPEEKRASTMSSLIARGKKWKNLIGVRHKEYKAIAEHVEKQPETSVERAYYRASQHEYRRSKQQIDGRVMIDHDTFDEYNPDAMPQLEIYDVVANSDYSPYGLSSPRASGDWRVNAQEGEAENDEEEAEAADPSDIYAFCKNVPEYEISDKQALIAPPAVPGYALREKVWVVFLVDEVNDITWDMTCFSKLEVALNVKQTLKCLVESHEKSRAKFQDVVARKGQGRVFLLHGPPGSGKTLTAETISEHVHKPLYYATSGELGTDTTVAEKRLVQIFDLAQRWEAILLIDEADVFLAKRTTDDLMRNAFVSVFLRTLEYYQGIMILTTNRREEFDDAFESRIHVSIAYRVPNAESRAAIWKNLFASYQPGAGISPETLKDLSRKYALNGRAIRNLFSTALAMSEDDGGVVRLQDIENLYALNTAMKDVD